MSQINPWKTKKITKKYENPWIQVDEHDVITPGNTAGIYGVVHFKNLALGIIPLDKEYNTYIVGQYRYPLNKYSWEIIEGGGSFNQPPIVSAKRELLEEAGIIADKWTPIMELDTSNSATDEHAIIYIAQELSFTENEPDITEDLVVKKLPFQQFFEEVMNGLHHDSLTVASVLKTKLLIDSGVI